jgi:hypothetical protein
MQKTNMVNINTALWYTTDISGEFPLMGGYKSDPTSRREGFIWIEADFNFKGLTKTRVHINANDFEIVGSAKPSEDLSDSEIESEISDRFEVMELLTKGVIDGSIKSLITSGAPGIGKTYTIDKMLLAAEREEKISKFSMMTGSCTAIGLFLQLWNHQNAGNVLVLDDIDSIFDDQESLNLLKGALDTGRTRTISWLGAGRFLENEGAENTFEFNGTVIFITNHNFDQRIAKGGKLAPHYEALISRCMYLDLGIHTMREVIIRIKQVIQKSDMMEELGVTTDQTEEMMAWMMNNINELRKVDLRTMIKLSQAMKAAPNNWQRIARVSLCIR